MQTKTAGGLGLRIMFGDNGSRSKARGTFFKRREPEHGDIEDMAIGTPTMSTIAKLPLQHTPPQSNTVLLGNLFSTSNDVDDSSVSLSEYQDSLALHEAEYHQLTYML